MKYDCSVTNRKGCNYCLRAKPLSSNEFEDVNIYDEDGIMVFGVNFVNQTASVIVDINYCPICGKRLS